MDKFVGSLGGGEAGLKAERPRVVEVGALTGRQPGRAHALAGGGEGAQDGSVEHLARGRPREGLSEPPGLALAPARPSCHLSLCSERFPAAAEPWGYGPPSRRENGRKPTRTGRSPCCGRLWCTDRSPGVPSGAVCPVSSQGVFVQRGACPSSAVSL